MQKRFVVFWWLGLLVTTIACEKATKQIVETVEQKPNIIFVMVDDLGYGDLGAYGQKVHKTPNLDKMAIEGRKFLQCYAGSPVCAPSRSTLMTGLHTGHTTVRGNFSPLPIPNSPTKGRVPLFESDVTVAEVLKKAGYVTGMTGKWGLGEPTTEGHPNRQGFDEWLGFLNQRRAHNHFAEYIWQNQDTLFLEGNDPSFDENNITFSHDLFTDFALDFIEKQKDTSFFLYVPYCLPHDHYHIPEEDLASFDSLAWTENEKVYAAMVARIDKDMGRIFTLLENLNLDKNTMVFFCSDNGAARRWEGRFDSSGKLKGRKRDMYEGGIRTPMIVWMPEKVPAGTESNYPWYFPDVLPTLADLADVQEIPTDLDGISVLPEILGETMPESDRFLYWEFHEKAFHQAVRWKNWKGIRQGTDGDLALYDLAKDPEETTDISTDNLEIVNTLTTYLSTARTESPYWKAKTKTQ